MDDREAPGTHSGEALPNGRRTGLDDRRPRPAAGSRRFGRCSRPRLGSAWCSRRPSPPKDRAEAVLGVKPGVAARRQTCSLQLDQVGEPEASRRLVRLGERHSKVREDG
jgi:hypothetical protein